MQVHCGLRLSAGVQPHCGRLLQGYGHHRTLLHLSQLRGRAHASTTCAKALSDYYAGQKLVRVAPFEGADGQLYGRSALAGDDDLTLTVAGNDGPDRW